MPMLFKGGGGEVVEEVEWLFLLSDCRMLYDNDS